MSGPNLSFRTNGGNLIRFQPAPPKKLQEVSIYADLKDRETTLKMQQLDCRQKIQVADKNIQVADKNIQVADKNIASGRQEMNPIIDKLITFLTQQKTNLDQVNLKKPTLEGQNLVEKIKGYISSLETAKNPETDAKVVVSTINTTQQSLQSLGAEIQKFQQTLNRK